MPTTVGPRKGIFVQRRLSALSAFVDVSVIMPSFYFPGLVKSETAIEPSEFPVTSLPVFYLPAILKHLDRIWLKRKLQPLIAKMHAARKFDVIDAHFGYPAGTACCEIGHALNIPTFVTVRGVEQSQLDMPRIGPAMLAALSHAHGIIAVSESLRSKFVNAGMDAGKIAVIPNAVDSNMFCLGDKDAARRELGLPLGVPIVISVGYLESRKGYHDLVPAFAKLRSRLPEALLVIVGESVKHELNYKKQIEDSIDKLALTGAVKFVGSKRPEEIPKWLHAADLFALATYREGCCNSVLEALACGLPVITTTAGDNEKYVIAGETGYTVPIGHVSQLADRLSEAFDRPWNSRKISESITSYQWKDVAENVFEFMKVRCQDRRLNKIEVPVTEPRCN